MKCNEKSMESMEVTYKMYQAWSGKPEDCWRAMVGAMRDE